MKRTAGIIALILLSASLFACSQNQKDDKILKIYKEILIVRADENDSLIANNKVEKILKENGYTIASFKNEFYNAAKDNKDFIVRLDSLRNSLNKEYLHNVDSVKKLQKSSAQ
jgi:galactitol-specific phosphotransferase system IIB component